MGEAVKVRTCDKHKVHLVGHVMLHRQEKWKPNCWRRARRNLDFSKYVSPLQRAPETLERRSMQPSTRQRKIQRRGNHRRSQEIHHRAIQHNLIDDVSCESNLRRVQREATVEVHLKRIRRSDDLSCRTHRSHWRRLSV